MKQNVKLHLIFLVLGFGGYLSYYCVIAQTNYWRKFYSNTTLTVFSMVYAVFEMIGCLVAIPLDKKFQPRVFPILHFTISIFALVVIVPMRQIENYYLKCILTALPIGFCAFTASMFYPCMISCATRVNPILSSTLQVGVGLSSIVIQTVEDLISIYFSHYDTEEEYERLLVLNAISYYVTGCVILALCFVMWFVFAKQFPNATRKAPPQQKKVLSNDSQPIPELSVTNTSADLLVGDVDSSSIQLPITENKQSIARRIMPLGIALLFNYVTCTIIFPLFALNVPSRIGAYKYNEPYSDWWSLIYLTIIQLSDFCGRMLPLSKKFVDFVSRKTVICLCYAKTVFLVLFPLMSLPKAVVLNEMVQKMPVISSDTLSIICAVLYAFFSSLLPTLGYIKYQDNLDTDEEKDKGSFVLNIFLECGLFGGSLVGVGLIPVFE
ncbi:Nucleoside_transporter [Hexamita inflata]|uniref:Nucleoside transporter n=1 Tax=Hexamita inflata TaxID=28002 RepID=A0AA86NYD7_9EUKA|nr:Nucleoside transporter [Hexamita inflata]